MNEGSIGQQIINGTYGLDNRPPTAYEELKAWCEKHLDADEYRVVPESRSFCASIYLDIWGNDNIPCIVFNRVGECTNACTVTNDEMCEHIHDYEDAPNDN